MSVYDKFVGTLLAVTLAIGVAFFGWNYYFPKGIEFARAAGTRDARRRSDLNMLKAALEAYAKANGTYLVKGGGGGGSGQGYVNNPYTGKSTVDILHDGGFLASSDVDDPVPTARLNYMLYLCDGGRRYALSATLEEPTKQDIEGIKKTCNAIGPNGTYTTYHKNYAVGN
jgi:hypothetical protein